MNEITRKMQERAKNLLENGEVKYVIGWEKGSFPHISSPVIITKPEEVNRLIWDDFCYANLSKYLLDYRYIDEKIAVFVKGCDSRGINRLIQDKQVEREKIYILGIPCSGLKNKEGDMEKRCQECNFPNPLIYDELLAEKIVKQNIIKPENRDFSDVEEIEKMSTDEKYDFWSKHYERCIRCYACRNVCPACNCKECIFDQTSKGWIGKANNISENKFFALTRAFHVAGRCIECGECERVCPMNIPIMLLNRKLIKDIGELFGEYDAGTNLDQEKPLEHFDAKNDPEEFI